MPEKSGRHPSWVSGWVPSLLIVIAIWLAWQIVVAVIVVRGPPLTAIRMAPTSAQALGRAAEAELVSKRVDSAAYLAKRSFQQAPFQVRAVRILGLTEAERGNEASADELLTLAGNWSLRDDPSHSWLVERRLRQGNYRSALSHADTLVRRRAEMAPLIFNLFSTAALHDPRAEQVLIERLAVSPPWARGYLRSLYDKPETLQLLPRLAIQLEGSRGRLDDVELGIMYRNWVAARRIPALAVIRQHINRPPATRQIVDGDFSGREGVEPFAWALGVGPGVTAILTEDDLRADNQALRIEYNGRGSTILAEQLLLLKPGSYLLKGETRAESEAVPRMEWAVVCFETDEIVGRHRAGVVRPDQGWRSFTIRLDIPAANCTAQYLRLQPRPEVRRAFDVIWYDNLDISTSFGEE